MTAHSTLTDPELHEPKGVASAINESAYFADGTGSGNWRKAYYMGWEDVADDATGSQSLTSGSYVDLANDGAGSNSVTTYRLPGAGAVWDATNNQFSWDTAGLEVGDTVHLRIDFTVTTSATNREISLALDMAHGDASEFRLNAGLWQLKTAAAYTLTANINVYIGSSAVLNNPTKVVMQSDGAGDSVEMTGFFVEMVKRNPVLHTA